MRAKLAMPFLVFLLLPYQANGQTFLRFPADTGGVTALTQWLKQHEQELPTEQQHITVDSKSSIFVVYHATGSGIPHIDTYVYGCNELSCHLSAVRRGITLPKGSQRLVAKLGKKELILASDKGKVFLRIPTD
jgi:hypothetical protein